MGASLVENGAAYPQRPGFTFATLERRSPNMWWTESDTFDGIYIEIVQYQKDGGFLVSCHASRPDWSRKQMGLTKRTPSYEEAKRIALDWLPGAEKFIAEIVTQENCTTPHVRTEKLVKRNWCRDCGWEEKR